MQDQLRALQIAFGPKQDWEPAIRANLHPRFAPHFVTLDDADLDAFDVVVPLRIEQYEALARRPDLFGRKFLHPSVEVTALCHDKLELTRFLIAHGFGAFVPALRTPGPPYPYVWKGRRGSWGRECYVVMGPGDESQFDLADQDWFAQALAPGSVEFATHILRANGEMRYVSTVPYGMAGRMLIRSPRHPPIDQKISRWCPYTALFGDILSALDCQGTACFNYKIINDKPLIFEINPRYGASLTMDVTAYVDAYFSALRAAPSS